MKDRCFEVEIEIKTEDGVKRGKYIMFHETPEAAKEELISQVLKVAGIYPVVVGVEEFRLKK